MDLRSVLHAVVLVVAAASFRVSAGCNYGVGFWYRSGPRPGRYTSNCTFIWPGYNCQKQGQVATGYLNFQWKPSKCWLPYFNAKRFLKTMQNKTIVVIGDSLAKDFYNALLCLISVAHPLNRWTKQLNATTLIGYQEPTFSVVITTMFHPYLVRYSHDPADFAAYNATYPGPLSRMPLVWVDEVDPVWASTLGFFDVAVLGTGAWWSGPVVAVAGGEVVNPTGLGPLRSALWAVRKHTRASKYKGMPVWLTFSPSHYVHFRCIIRFPLRYAASVEESRKWADHIQLEREVFYPSNFRVINITALSIARPDAHVGVYHGDVTHYDCLHWCLPGVPDTWVDVFQYVLPKRF